LNIYAIEQKMPPPKGGKTAAALKEVSHGGFLTTYQTMRYFQSYTGYRTILLPFIQE
jgi:hypothetical protein